jgi:hypothetical protein
LKEAKNKRGGEPHFLLVRLHWMHAIDHVSAADRALAIVIFEISMSHRYGEWIVQLPTNAPLGHPRRRRRAPFRRG